MLSAPVQIARLFIVNPNLLSNEPRARPAQLLVAKLIMLQIRVPSVFHPWLRFRKRFAGGRQAGLVKAEAEASSNLKLAIGNGRVKVSVQSSV